MFKFKGKQTGGFRTLNQGVHLVEVSESTLKHLVSEKSPAENLLYGVSCTLTDKEGTSVKFVGMGSFNDVKLGEEHLFKTATEVWDDDNNAKKSAMRIKDATERKAELKKINGVIASHRNTSKNPGVPYYNTVAYLNELAEFVQGFGAKAYEAIVNVDAPTIKDTVEAYLRILETSGFSYVSLMEQDYEKNGKVIRRKSLTQNYQPMQSWSVNSVKFVETNYDELGNDIVGFTVTFQNDRTTKIQRNKFTYDVKSVVPNDEPNEGVSIDGIPSDESIRNSLPDDNPVSDIVGDMPW